MKNIVKEIIFSEGQTTIDLLIYVDNIVILGNNIKEVKSLCRQKLIETAKMVWLQINDNKTEFMSLNIKATISCNKELWEK